MGAPRILVAGIGNIFLGDDAFGSEVARALIARGEPEGAEVVDFGVRGYDLSRALEGRDAAILVDAMKRGGPPGTLYVIEPKVKATSAPFDLHKLTPERVLAGLAPDVRPRTIFVVGCEVSGSHDEDPMKLSDVVAAAVEPAMALIGNLVRELTEEADA